MADPDGAALNQITSNVISAAIEIHRLFGCGLLETAYMACLCQELMLRGVHIEVQKNIPVVYRGRQIDCAFRPDLIVERSVVVEVKAVDALAPVHFRQLQTYLRLTDCRVGLLLNFGAETLSKGIKRVVNEFPD